MKKKIAFIGSKGIPATYGGIQHVVEEISTRLVLLYNVEVFVYARSSYVKRKKNYTYKGVNVIIIPEIKSKYIGTLFHSFFSTMNAIFVRVDVFHFQGIGPSIWAFIPRLLGKTTILSVHEILWYSDKWSIWGRLILKYGERIFISFFNKVHVLSRVMYDYYLNKFDLECTIIPNGVVAPKKFEPKSKLIQIGLTNEDYILFIGRLLQGKGIETLIKSYILSKIDAKLVIAGPYTDSKYFDYLKKIANQKNSIKFIGNVTGEIKNALIANARFVVIPSVYEGFSIVLLEAMSFGKNILLSDIKIFKEVCTCQYQLNFLCHTFNTDDIYDLSSKLKIFFYKREIHDNVNLIKIVKRCYDWDIIIKSYVNLLYEIKP